MLLLFVNLTTPFLSKSYFSGNELSAYFLLIHNVKIVLLKQLKNFQFSFLTIMLKCLRGNDNKRDKGFYKLFESPAA